MIDYYFYMLRGRKLNPKVGCKLFNKYKLKSYVPLLTKSGLKINKNVSIVKPFTFTDGNIEIGNSAYINAGCFFLDAGLVKIGSRTLIGPNCQFYTMTHHVNPKERFNDSTAVIKNINIGDNVWIGGGVIVCPGVSIGNNSVIAAGSVVITDVPDNVLYAGNPAIFKKNLS